MEDMEEEEEETKQPLQRCQRLVLPQQSVPLIRTAFLDGDGFFSIRQVFPGAAGGGVHLPTSIYIVR